MAADVHALAGAYVLDSIEPTERARFEVHLGQCASCQMEVAAFQDTTVVFTTLTTTPAPVGLRQRVLAAIHRTPQLRPVTATQLSPRVATSRIARLLVAAAALIVAVGTTMAVLDRGTDHGDGRITARTVLAATDVEVREVALDDAAFTVAASHRLGLVAVVAEESDLRPGQVHQLWVITETARSLTVLEDGQGIATTPTRGRLAVTVEPAEGSPQPTTVPLFALDVTKLDHA